MKQARATAASGKARRGARVVAAFGLTFLLLSAGMAVAKPGGGGSIGSRGTRSYSAPAATPTAPSGATPFNRSAAPAEAPRSSFGAPAASGLNAARPASRFGGGLMGGLIGAGIFGALLGAGFSGGLGGIMSFIGLILQFALLALIVSMALRWFRSRSQPATVGYARDAASSPPRSPLSAGRVGGLSGSQPRSAGAAPHPTRDVTIAPSDYETFERLLGKVQGAYSEENIQALKNVATPEMVSYFQEELLENNRRGVINRVSNVKLLQGDLSEAWGEPTGDYATVAMRYALVDEMLDRATGKPAPGGSKAPQEATEVWTFVRPADARSASDWKLSAIQQAA